MKLRNLLVILLLLTGAVLFVACEGKDGVDGKDGARGPAGPAGKDGKDGKDGTPGPAGADGRVGDKGDPYGDTRCDVANGILSILGLNNNNITGTAGDDVICGTLAINDIRAGGGDDTVYGGDGDDKLIGGAGDDTLYGEGGNDHFFVRSDVGANKLFGGEGDNDLMYLGNPPTSTTSVPNAFGFYPDVNLFSINLTVDLSSGTLDLATQLRGQTVQGTFVFEGIEDLLGGAANDTLTGTDKDNYIYGERGDDTINGGKGDDTLLGSGGDDTIDGGEGDDLIYGGGGADTLTGGAGADTFLIQKDAGTDLIKDFDLTEDKIYFRSFGAGDNARAITVANGKISVGGTEYVTIVNADDDLDNATAEKIKSEKKYRFVNAAYDKKTRAYTFTDG